MYLLLRPELVANVSETVATSFVSAFVDHRSSGDVLWMTAGKGALHSEMPQQESGQMHGFQIWLNLPAAEKMKPAHYQALLKD